MPAPPRDHPINALFQPTALIAMLLAGEGLALILSLAPGIDRDMLVRFGLASIGIQWIAIATVGAMYLLRRILVRLPPRALPFVCLGLLLLMTFLLSLIALHLLEIAQPGTEPARTPFVLRMLGIALIVGLAGLVTYQNYWRAKQLAVRAKQAELETLQARIHPHFLFNTINTGIALVHARPQEAERLLLDLSDLFRAALSGPAEVSLSEELALARRYLEIESLRFGDRLDVHWDLPEGNVDLPRIMLPPLSIQPLVENAIKHGIEPDIVGGRITVSVDVSATATTVTIRNSLPANSPLFPNGHRIGLPAVRARIEASTGGKGHVDTRVSESEFIATLRLPHVERK